MIAMKFTALVTLAAVVQTFLLSARVGAARGKLGIEAPATSGKPEFDKAFRIHMNTVEQLVLFIPMLWLAARVIGDVWAPAVGAIWIVGRVVYASGYRNDIAKRGPGMLMTVFSTAVLAAITVWGIRQSFMA